MNDMNEMDKTDRNRIDKINETNGDELKNIFSAGMGKISKKSNKRGKSRLPRRISLLNIGQILIICLLCFVIFTQAAEIIPGLSGSNPGSGEDISNGISPGGDNNAAVSPARSAGKPGAGQNTDSGGNIVDNISENEDDNTQAIFILGENDGKLAVLSPDRSTIYEVYDVYINTLPDYDKNLLENGINITTAEELRSLLEDYTS